MKPILEVQHVGKEFYIGGTKERYLSLRDVLHNSIKKLRQPKPQSFWALEDVSFDIMPGESIGIIGRNGAGKSTLLKILSKITPPTKGKIICRGRIASLLEVGTGFHPELTGRENIYMNGSILGMRKTEINRHFDAIVDFSGVEQFLDTPLKRYSSGMQLRLAFAVAAHLEPEILVIDEVLAVGDAEFQKKCLGKMDEVSKSGRTILFVSHNLAAVQQLCPRSLLLSEGKVLQSADTGTVIATYLGLKQEKDLTKVFHLDKELHIKNFRLIEQNNGAIQPGSACSFEVDIYNSQINIDKLHIGFGINDKTGHRLFTLFSRYDGNTFPIKQGMNTIRCDVDFLPLKPDVYGLHIFAGSEFEAYDYISDGLDFEVIPHPFFKNYMPDETQGAIILPQRWSLL